MAQVQKFVERSGCFRADWNVAFQMGSVSTLGGLGANAARRRGANVSEPWNGQPSLVIDSAPVCGWAALCRKECGPELCLQGDSMRPPGDRSGQAPIGQEVAWSWMPSAQPPYIAPVEPMRF